MTSAASKPFSDMMLPHVLPHRPPPAAQLFVGAWSLVSRSLKRQGALALGRLGLVGKNSSDSGLLAKVCSDDGPFLIAHDDFERASRLDVARAARKISGR